MALPLVLVGPIVRRVDSEIASVFVALSRPASVELRIWTSVRKAKVGTPGQVEGDGPLIASGVSQTRRFGERLHATVVVAELSTPLLPGQLHSYDLVFDTGDGQPTGLRDHGLLAEGRVVGSHADAPASLPLGYGEDVLPAFVTCPALIEDLRVAHASCRRSDVAGDDALAYLDTIIGSRREGSVPPPHMLVLTGDQVYADGVAAPLLPMFDEVGREMLGGDAEDLPLADGGILTADTLRLPPLHRQRICSLDAKFGTRGGHSHIFSFAEFCGLYALNYSTSVWRTMPGVDAFPDLAGISQSTRSHLTDWDTRLAAEPERLAKVVAAKRAQWAAEIQSAEVFRAAMPNVARALANVSTYMMFDDHEVSDDWNLTAGHRRRTLESPLGQRVIANALAACVLFQSWGNDPRSFDPPAGSPATPNSRLLDAIGAPGTPDRDTIIDLLALRPGPVDAQVDLGFKVDGPAHRLIAIDTRNHREFSSDFSPPALMRPEAIDVAIPEGPLPAGQQVLFVLSPAPVVHPPLVDSIAQPLTAAVFDLVGAITYSRRQLDNEDLAHPEGRAPDENGFVGASEAEVELWYGDRRAFEHLLQRLATHPRVVVLSGDVHFSVSLGIDAWLHKNLPGASSRIVQLTGSAARNHWREIVRLVLRAFRPFQHMIELGAPVTQLVWERSDPPPVDGVTGRRDLELKLDQNPVRVPANRWPAGSQQTRPVDFAYRLQLVSDQRPDIERATQLGALLPPFSEIDPNDPFDGYRRVFERHQIGMRNSAQVRTLVYPHNVSEVSFTTEADGLHVLHHIVSRVEHGGAGVLPEVLALHDTLLEPTSDERPTIIVEGG